MPDLIDQILARISGNPAPEPTPEPAPTPPADAPPTPPAGVTPDQMAAMRAEIEAQYAAELAKRDQALAALAARPEPNAGDGNPLYQELTDADVKHLLDLPYGSEAREKAFTDFRIRAGRTSLPRMQGARAGANDLL